MKSLSYDQVAAVAALPTATTALKGTIVRLTTDDKPYWCNGAAWVDLTATGAGGGGATEAISRIIKKTSHGRAVGDFIYSDGTPWDGLGSLVDGSRRAYVVSSVTNANEVVAVSEGFVAASISGLVTTNQYTPDITPATAGKPKQDTLNKGTLGNTYSEYMAILQLPIPTLAYSAAHAGWMLEQADPINLASQMAGTISIQQSSAFTKGTLVRFAPGQGLQLAEATATTKFATHIVGALLDVNGIYYHALMDFIQSDPIELLGIAVTAADGTPVYLSATPGLLTTIRPALAQQVGEVLGNILISSPSVARFSPLVIATSQPASPIVGQIWIDNS